MQSLANRLAIQHFVNAYTQETGKGHLLNKNQQSPQQQAFSQGLTLLSIPIHSIQAQCNLFHKLLFMAKSRHLVLLQSSGYCLKNWFLNRLFH